MMVPDLEYMVANCGPMWNILIVESLTQQQKQSPQLGIFDNVYGLDGNELDIYMRNGACFPNT
jgi:hypothetical protein